MKDTIIDARIIDNDEWYGYQIVTNYQTIELCIDKFTSCCEKWYTDIILPSKKNKMTDEQKLQSIIGLELVNLPKRNTSVYWGKSVRDFDKEIFTASIEINTKIGIITLICINEHNGYYPHSIYVKWKDFYDKQQL